MILEVKGTIITFRFTFSILQVTLKYDYIVGLGAGVAQLEDVGARAILAPKLHHVIHKIEGPALAHDADALAIGDQIDPGRGQEGLPGGDEEAECPPERRSKA